MLERGLFPVVWKMKSLSKICLLDAEGFAVNIFNDPPRDSVLFPGAAWRFPRQGVAESESYLLFDEGPAGDGRRREVMVTRVRTL